MVTATTSAVADVEAPGPLAPCAWCDEPLTSPYLRRPDDTGLHVACARSYARAQAPSA